jgi:hypothetical protein
MVNGRTTGIVSVGADDEIVAVHITGIGDRFPEVGFQLVAFGCPSRIGDRYGLARCPDD